MTGGDGEPCGAGCALCRAAREPRPAPAGTVVLAVDDLVALVDEHVPGVLVAPRAHMEGLTTAPVEAGVVLGALRRVAITVQSSYGASRTSIEPTTELAGAAGHVCYRVVPVAGDAPMPPGSGPGVDPQVLAAALRHAVAEHDAPAPG